MLDLESALTLVTDARVNVDPNVVDGEVRVYVTARAPDALGPASEAVGSALTLLGYRGRRLRVNDRLMWRTVVGTSGTCKGYPDEYRCGFVVHA